MTRTLLMAFALAFAVAPAAQAQTYGSDCPIAGRYSVSGTTPVGARYSGEMTLTSNGAGCYAKWYPPNDSEGVGTYVNGVLTINFQLSGGRGVVRYTRREGGELSGTWWMNASPSSVGTETLFPIKLARP